MRSRSTRSTAVSFGQYSQTPSPRPSAADASAICERLGQPSHISMTTPLLSFLAISAAGSATGRMDGRQIESLWRSLVGSNRGSSITPTASSVGEKYNARKVMSEVRGFSGAPKETVFDEQCDGRGLNQLVEGNGRLCAGGDGVAKAAQLLVMAFVLIAAPEHRPVTRLRQRFIVVDDVRLAVAEDLDALLRQPRLRAERRVDQVRQAAVRVADRRA